MKPQELSNEDLIEKVRDINKKRLLTHPYVKELITRFERLSLGKDAEKAIEKLEELQQPTLQVGWEYKDGDLDWVWIVDHNKQDNKFLSNDGEEYLSDGNCCSTDLPKLILSTGRPVKKVQDDDEVEALAEKLWVNNYTHEPDRAFIMAEQFINHRNERRGKNGK
jgi:hypothetical protein